MESNEQVIISKDEYENLLRYKEKARIEAAVKRKKGKTYEKYLYAIGLIEYMKNNILDASDIISEYNMYREDMGFDEEIEDEFI